MKILQVPPCLFIGGRQHDAFMTIRQNDGPVLIALALYRPNVEFLVAQLKSIAHQSFKNWICIIGADSDLDELREEACLQEFFSDERFQWRQNPERYGYALNFQNLIRVCLSFNPVALAFCDQDDVWRADKLEVCLKELEDHPEIQLLMHDMYQIRGGEFIEQTYRDLLPPPKLRIKSSVILALGGTFGCSMMFRPELAQRFASIQSAMGDHDYTLALLASVENSLRFLDKPLSHYRLHENNTIGIGMPEEEVSDKKAVEQWRNAFRTGEARFKVKKESWDLVKPHCRGHFGLCDLLISSPDLGVLSVLYGLLFFPFSRFYAKEWMATGIGKLMISVGGRK